MTVEPAVPATLAVPAVPAVPLVPAVAPASTLIEVNFDALLPR